MDRIEIVDPGANGEAGFSIESKKWPAVEERVIMLSTAGTEYTLSKPSLCPYYGDHLRIPYNHTSILFTNLLLLIY